jgi:hypothetical protein
MNTDNTLVRAVHDLSQAAWFGGALMGATAVDQGARALNDRTARLDVVDRTWSSWQRVSTPAILLHLAAGVKLTVANKGRLVGQQGAVTTTGARTAVTLAAVASDLYARRLGRKLGQTSGAAVEDSTTPAETTDEQTAAVQRRLKVVQWVTVGLTGTMIVLGARMGEQQRPANVAAGALRRLGIAA